jgi:hypothetical protein
MDQRSEVVGMMLRCKKARHLAGRNFAGAKQGDWEGGKRLGVPHMADEGVRGLPPHGFVLRFLQGEFVWCRAFTGSALIPKLRALLISAGQPAYGSISTATDECALLRTVTETCS